MKLLRNRDHWTSVMRWMVRRIQLRMMFSGMIITVPRAVAVGLAVVRYAVRGAAPGLACPPEQSRAAG